MADGTTLPIVEEKIIGDTVDSVSPEIVSTPETNEETTTPPAPNNPLAYSEEDDVVVIVDSTESVPPPSIEAPSIEVPSTPTPTAPPPSISAPKPNDPQKDNAIVSIGKNFLSAILSNPERLTKWYLEAREYVYSDWVISTQLRISTYEVEARKIDAILNSQDLSANETARLNKRYRMLKRCTEYCTQKKEEMEESAVKIDDWYKEMIMHASGKFRETGIAKAVDKIPDWAIYLVGFIWVEARTIKKLRKQIKEELLLIDDLLELGTPLPEKTAETQTETADNPK
jgi:hypothetical protein